MSPVIIIHLAGDANINLPPLVLDKRDHVVLPPQGHSVPLNKPAEGEGNGEEGREPKGEKLRVTNSDSLQAV